MSSATETKSTAVIGGEIARKRARRDALKFRQGEVAAELEKLFTGQARALADGVPFPAKANIATLEQEREGTARAIALLDGEIDTLLREQSDTAFAEAQVAEQSAITAAADAFAQIDATLRSFAIETLIPQTDVAFALLRQARDATNATDNSQRAAVGTVTGVPNRADRATHRRGALLATIKQLRSFLDD